MIVTRFMPAVPANPLPTETKGEYQDQAAGLAGLTCFAGYAGFAAALQAAGAGWSEQSANTVVGLQPAGPDLASQATQDRNEQQEQLASLLILQAGLLPTALASLADLEADLAGGGQSAGNSLSGSAAISGLAVFAGENRPAALAAGKSAEPLPAASGNGAGEFTRVAAELAAANLPSALSRTLPKAGDPARRLQPGFSEITGLEVPQPAEALPAVDPDGGYSQGSAAVRTTMPIGFAAEGTIRPPLPEGAADRETDSAANKEPLIAGLDPDSWTGSLAAARQSGTGGAAATAGSAAPDQATSSQIVRQLVDSAAMTWQGDNQVIEIKLKPDHFGDVQIRLVKTGDGLAAQIKTDNPVTRHLLAAQLNQLQESLQGRGLNISQIDIQYAASVADFNSARQSQSDSANRQHQPPRQETGSIKNPAAGSGSEAILARSGITAAQAGRINCLA